MSQAGVFTSGGSGGGDVSGPGSSTVGNLPVWDDTSGTLLADSGVPIADVMGKGKPIISPITNLNSSYRSIYSIYTLQSGANITADRINLIPVYNGARFVLNEIGFNVATYTSGGDVTLGIYAINSTTGEGALLQTLGSLTVSATGIVGLTGLSYSFPMGWVYVAIHWSGGDYNSTNIATNNVKFDSITNPTTHLGGVFTSSPYGSLPSSVSPGTGNQNIFVWFKGTVS